MPDFSRDSMPMKSAAAAAQLASAVTRNTPAQASSFIPESPGILPRLQAVGSPDASAAPCVDARSTSRMNRNGFTSRHTGIRKFTKLQHGDCENPARPIARAFAAERYSQMKK